MSTSAYIARLQVDLFLLIFPSLKGWPTQLAGHFKVLMHSAFAPGKAHTRTAFPQRTGPFYPSQHHHYTTTQDGQAIKPSERIAANQALPELERALREELEAEGVDVQVRGWAGGCVIAGLCVWGGAGVVAVADWR